MSFPEVTPGSKHYALDPESEDGKYLAQQIWWYGPKFSPKDVPAFYDVSSITEDPKCFGKVIELFVNRYKAMGEAGPTHVLGYDARGFLIGPPIALALGIPFVLFRKDAKNPGVVVESSGYSKEYAEKKLDAMCMRLGAIKPGARVLLIDDLIATGGTALAGFELCLSCDVEVLEFAAVIDLPFCEGVQKIRAYADGRFKDTPIFTLVDGRTIPDSNGRDPKEWAEASRVVPAPKAKEIMAKYPSLS
jgi:adenine phosphoribosyltransferase